MEQDLLRLGHQVEKMRFAVHQGIETRQANEQHQPNPHTTEERLRHPVDRRHHGIGMRNGEAQVVDVGQPTPGGGLGCFGKGQHLFLLQSLIEGGQLHGREQEPLLHCLQVDLIAGALAIHLAQGIGLGGAHLQQGTCLEVLDESPQDSSLS